MAIPVNTNSAATTRNCFGYLNAWNNKPINPKIGGGNKIGYTLCFLLRSGQLGLVANSFSINGFDATQPIAINEISMALEIILASAKFQRKYLKYIQPSW